MTDNTSQIPSIMTAWLWSSTAGGLQTNLYKSDTAYRPGQTLRPHQCLIKISSTSLNPADYKVPEDAPSLLWKCVVSSPASPGMDFSGVVVATGAKVTNVRIGQRVFGCLPLPRQYGTLAEYSVADAGLVVPVPEGVDLDDAATVGIAGQTALQVIKGQVQSGDHIFINGGSGGVGTYAIQIAKAYGCHVTATCSTRNVELLKSLGADEVLDYTTVDVVDYLRKQGPLFSLALDMIGKPDDMYEDMKEIADLMQDGKVKPVIDTVFEFDDAVKAFERLRTNRARGKTSQKLIATPMSDDGGTFVSSLMQRSCCKLYAIGILV
ncbi:zinc ion binding protein [Talaromyces marneffei ATCC 18224]